jgi:ABC-2 type transport system permease protein
MLIPLIRNETLKLLRRRRFAIVIGILVAIIGIVSYSQYRLLAGQKNRNWRAETQQHIASYQNALRRGRVNESWARSMRAEINRLQFYLDHDIEPNKPTAPTFVRGFANIAGILLLPLLVAVLGSDIVSAEHAEGTDKLLLTRPVKRWKILASKLITLWLFATLTLLCGAILAYVISAPFLPARGWTAPTYTGFQLSANTFKADTVRELPMWEDALIVYGLDWFALAAVSSIALMLSVLFRSSAGSIGTMLASLIGGTILTRLSPDWTAGKYLFVSALPLADYYTGEPPPYEGMSMTFCLLLLSAWAVGAIIVAFSVFTRKDVFG